MAPGAAEITKVFAPGEYYAIIKGNGNTQSPPSSDTARGWYQLTFGDRTLAQDDQIFTPPVWGDASSGVMRDLLAKSIRVISVTSTIGTDHPNNVVPLEQQADTLANATGAVGPTGSPLRFNINASGDGMGYATVQAVNNLAQNLEMDVQVRLVESPDLPLPRPGFKFVARAIKTPGNRCAGPIDSDGDGILDTHLNCSPGAVPRFEVSFTNPAVPNHVRLNPNDPNGGYTMRIELIGDGKYIVDRIPVYIIPANVVPDPNPPVYAASGTYSQQASAAGCFGTERPDWQSLQWNATVPSGTSLQWRICTGDTPGQAASCNTSVAADVISGGACDTSNPDPNQCPNGFCQNGSCMYVSGPVCGADSECGVNGKCVTNICMYTGMPMGIKPFLTRGANGKSQLKVQVKLKSNPSHSAAPVIHDYRLNYTCKPNE